MYDEGNVAYLSQGAPLGTRASSSYLSCPGGSDRWLLPTPWGPPPHRDLCWTSTWRLMLDSPPGCCSFHLSTKEKQTLVNRRCVWGLSTERATITHSLWMLRFRSGTGSLWRTTRRCLWKCSQSGSLWCCTEGSLGAVFSGSSPSPRGGPLCCWWASKL